MSGIRRWLENFLILYALFLILYLVLRFLVQAEWNLFLLVHNGAPYLFLFILIGLGLALLLGSRRLAGIYFLLSLIGLLWFAPILISKFKSYGEDINPIKIISFNFYPDNPDTATALEWLLGQDADIVLLQELPTALPELEAAFPYYEYNATGETFAVFSNYPILNNNEFSLEGEVQQRVILDVNGQNVALYNLHLLMPLNENDGDFLLLRYDESRRNAQIEQILSAAASETIPLLLVGDFNMSEWSPVYSTIAASLKDAYREASWGLGPTWPSGESEELGDFLPPLVRLDYLWYSESFEPVSALVGTSLGSDHSPLIVELILE